MYNFDIDGGFRYTANVYFVVHTFCYTVHIYIYSVMEYTEDKTLQQLEPLTQMQLGLLYDYIHHTRFLS